MATNPLHELLLRDWGTDLPIRGGFGQSREDPIIVDSSDPMRAVETQMLVLRGLGRGRGIFWRCLQRNSLGDKWPGIEQFKIETVELTDNEIITQTENYYFDLSALNSGGAVSMRPTLIVHSDKSGLARRAAPHADVAVLDSSVDLDTPYAGRVTTHPSAAL